MRASGLVVPKKAWDFLTTDLVHVPYIGSGFLTIGPPGSPLDLLSYLCFRAKYLHVYIHAKKKYEYRNTDSNIIYKDPNIKNSLSRQMASNINREMTKLQLIYLVEYFAFIKMNELLNIIGHEKIAR